MARIVSLLLGIFIAAKLYFFQTESREFSSGAESSDLGDFIETLPAFLKFLIPF